MKFRRLLPLVAFLVLAGCTPKPSESLGSDGPPVTSQVSTEPSEVSQPTESNVVSSEISEEPDSESAIEFGADPFAGTALTGVAGVGVALYFDATENNQAVALSQVEFTITAQASVLFKPQIGFVEKLEIYYYRALEPGNYLITLTVEDSAGLKATATHDVVVASGDLSGNQEAIKAAVAGIYPNNIATQLDYRSAEGVFNEWVVVGKNFSVFERVNNTGNYATVFVPFARFEGGEPLANFTISFKYTTLNEAWKLLFSFWTGEAGNDGFADDYLRLLTNRNEIGIMGDTEQNSEFQDSGEAKGIPMKEGPVWIKFTRQITNTNTATFKLYTSTDGSTYTLKTTSVINGAGTGAGDAAAKVTGFLPFSIDNDFIIEQLAVSPTVFTI